MNLTELYLSYHLNDLPRVAEQLLHLGKNHNIWLFEGEMGSGKTTLIKAIAQALGVQERVQSPTFSLVNTYKTAEQGVIYHFDFYRISAEEEVWDMGYEEYFFSPALCLVEWASKIPNLIPPTYFQIYIDKLNAQERSLKAFLF